MPGKDGKGPAGGGKPGRGGQGMGGGRGMGAGGECVCPQCGEVAPHRPGVPCTSVQCPKCGSQMIRK